MASERRSSASPTNGSRHEQRAVTKGERKLFLDDFIQRYGPSMTGLGSVALTFF
jgi:hypothetical protein